ncbi:hypothetical protein BH18VER1_BH18VER1_08440 [soil metagenome]
MGQLGSYLKGVYCKSLRSKGLLFDCLLRLRLCQKVAALVASTPATISNEIPPIACREICR